MLNEKRGISLKKLKTMEPKNKANELVAKFKNATVLSKQRAQQCAIIAVDEAINEVNQNFTSERYAFWQSVKKEINNL